MSEKIKVRVNRKMVDDWKQRDLTDMPRTAGTHEFTLDEAQVMVRFLKDEIWNFVDYGDMKDMVEASMRQLNNFVKAIDGK